MIVGQLPDNFDPSSVDEAAIQAINLLNEEMVAVGVGVGVSAERVRGSEGQILRDANERE